MGGVSGSCLAARKEHVRGRGGLSPRLVAFGMGWKPVPPHLTRPGWVAGSETAGKVLGHGLG